MFRLRDVSDLLSLERSDILSVYLNVDPAERDNQRHPPAYRIWLKNALDELPEEGPRDEIMALRRLKDAVQERMVDFRPEGKGLALFVADGLDVTFDLPMATLPAMSYGRPYLTPLLWLLDEYERYGIVQVDHEEAHLFTAYLGRAQPHDRLAFELDTSDWRRKDLMPSTSYGKMVSEGSHRDLFQQRVDEAQKHFFKEVADEVRSWVDELALERLVVGGDEQAARTLVGLMPKGVADRVIATVPMPRYENDATLLQRIMEVAEPHERKFEAALVGEIIDAALAAGNGALGIEDVLHGLQEGRVRLVAKTWPASGTVWRCTGCGYLFGQPVAACPSCGGTLVTEELAEVLPEVIRRASATLELVHGEPAERLEPYQGIGALLRF